MDSDSDEDKYYTSQELEDEAMPTFATVFHLRASKPRFICAFWGPKLFCGLPHKK